MKIVVDAFGGDYAPSEVVKGAALAVQQSKEIEVVLVGKDSEINDILVKNKLSKKGITIVNATEIITNDDIPTLAIKNKKNSSLVVALDYLNSNEDATALVSAGSTGAVLAGSMLKLGRIKGVSRPALSPVLPTINGGKVALIDCGANVDSKPNFLCDFAVMGSIFMRSQYGIENPRVALLSNGVEDKKGNELNKQAFALLKEVPNINFVGNMEARDFLSGDYDVVVTDGFAGNVCLKAVEGTAGMVMGKLKQEIKASFKAKIGALFMKKAFKNLKATLDYNLAGGACFLGVKKVVVKSHGSSQASAICNSILQANKLAENNIVNQIDSEISKILIQNEEVAN